MKGEIALFILSGISPVFLAIIAYFLRDLIQQFKILQAEVLKMNEKIINLNKDMGYHDSSINHLSIRIDKHESESLVYRDRLTKLETEHDLLTCKKE